MAALARHGSSPHSPTKPETLREGFLTKRAITGHFGIHLWKTNYFVLDDHHSLTYYKGREGKLRGQILLTHDSTVGPSDKRSYCLVLETPYVTLHAQAESDEDRDAWVLAIRGAINQAATESKKHMWKQMRERAFAERSAERRALAAANALELITDEKSFTEVTYEDMVKYKTRRQVRDDDCEKGESQSLKLKKKQMRERAFAERRATRRASATAKALKAIADAEEPQVPDCCFESIQAPSSKPSVQATASKLETRNASQ